MTMRQLNIRTTSAFPAAMSTSETSPSATLQELIDALKEAQQERRHARNWISVLLLVIVAVFGYLGYEAVVGFQSEENMETFGTALQAELEEDLQPILSRELSGMAERVVPAFQDAFSRVVERDAPAYEEMVTTELVALEDHALDAWPLIQEGIAEMVAQQEMTTREALEAYIEPEELRRINAAYSVEVNDAIERMVERNFGTEAILAEDIMMKLELLAEEEPAPGLDDPQFILGMFIELLGYEMQRNAAELSGSQEAAGTLEASDE